VLAYVGLFQNLKDRKDLSLSISRSLSLSFSLSSSLALSLSLSLSFSLSLSHTHSCSLSLISLSLSPMLPWHMLTRSLTHTLSHSPQSVIKSSVSIALICTTSHRIPESASTNQGAEMAFDRGRQMLPLHVRGERDEERV